MNRTIRSFYSLLFYRERERESIDSNLRVNIVYNQSVVSENSHRDPLEVSLKITSLLKGRAEEWSRVATSFETFD